MPVSFEVDLTLPRINPLIEVLIVGDLVLASEQWARDVRDKAQEYPPKRPGQRYVRTYRLRRGWTIVHPRLEANGDIVTEVTNDVPYNEKVHGDSQGAGQAAIHRNRWSKLLQIGASVLPLQIRAQAALNRRMQNAIVQETIRVT